MNEQIYSRCTWKEYSSKKSKMKYNGMSEALIKVELSGKVYVHHYTIEAPIRKPEEVHKAIEEDFIEQINRKEKS